MKLPQFKRQDRESARDAIAAAQQQQCDADSQTPAVNRQAITARYLARLADEFMQAVEESWKPRESR